ncbi:putative adhesin [Escherichia coli]|uniref:Putative adhesin n=1 Tax=Escherichia coli TaxID=562 RepID=A0A376V9J4_ECOLX|nr:putative adhesin [Escherichia coli]
MAGKAHGNGDRRGDNTICGLGDRLRRLTAGICLITQTIFPVMAAAPTHINPAHSDTAASLILPNVKTIPYTLGALESPPTVAARFGITVDELRRLNQFRTFARGFDNVRQGDEIDVPLINSNSPEARNLKANADGARRQRSANAGRGNGAAKRNTFSSRYGQRTGGEYGAWLGGFFCICAGNGLAQSLGNCPGISWCG